MTIRSEIGAAVAARLATVTVANGYTSDLKAVHYLDMTPMGLELAPEQMPALFLLDDGQDHRHQHGVLDISWVIRLQIFHIEGASDEQMNQLLRDCAKALWANSPTAEVIDQFRSIHPRIYQLESLGDETDLNMIEANRVATARYVVHYRTKPYDL